MKKTLVLLCCLAFGLSAAAQTNIIFDTDMGNDVEDAVALDVLYKFDEMKKANLMAIMLNKMGDYPLQYVDLLNTWYGHKRVPIGSIGGPNPDIWPKPNFAKILVEMKDEDGKPVYKRTIKDVSKLTPAPELYRKLLAKAKDKSVTIVSVGYSTNLALLLSTEGDKYSPLSGKDLVEKKVYRLVMMAGHMTDPNFREWNVKGDIPSCQKVYNEWPSPIYTIPCELGFKIRLPRKMYSEDFGWAKHHPLVDSYFNYRTNHKDTPMWDTSSVLFAVEPDMFGLSPRGRITITDNANSLFTPDPNGNHYYLVTTKEQEKKLLDFYLDIIPRKPARVKLK